MPKKKPRPAPAKRPGRPPAGDDALAERVMIRLTPDRRAAWEAAAAADARPLGQWIRFQIERVLAD
jgi:hypothetical protein